MNVRKIQYTQQPQLQPTQATKMAFQEEEPKQVAKKSGLKIDNSNSAIKNQEQSDVDFDKKINEIVSNEEEQQKLYFELVSTLLAMVRDKTLDSVKDLKVKEAEKVHIKKIINFTRTVNADPNQEDDLGTMSLFAMVFRICMMQRDRINDLEYELSKVKKENAILVSKIEQFLAKS